MFDERTGNLEAIRNNAAVPLVKETAVVVEQMVEKMNQNTVSLNLDTAGNLAASSAARLNVVDD